MIIMTMATALTQCTILTHAGCNTLREPAPTSGAAGRTSDRLSPELTVVLDIRASRLSNLTDQRAQRRIVTLPAPGPLKIHAMADQWPMAGMALILGLHCIVQRGFGKAEFSFVFRIFAHDLIRQRQSVRPPV
jgi:hypothetical protein